MKMKFKLKLVIIAGIMMAAMSCVKVKENNLPAQEIEFTAVTGKNINTTPKSVGLINGVVYPQAEHFGVYATYESAGIVKRYIDNADVFYNSISDGTTTTNIWKAAVSYYWPVNTELKFYGYSPYDISSAVDLTDKIIATGYDLKIYPNEDFMVADTLSIDFANRRAVPMVFRHQLSHVAIIRVKTKEDYSATTSYTVKKIAFKNIKTVGDYQYSRSETNKWRAQREPADYIWFEGSRDVTHVLDTIARDGGISYMMVLPQEFSDVNTEILEVTYDFKVDNGTDTVVIPMTAELPLYTVHPDHRWLSNKRIVYTLTFDAGDQIIFDPTVVDWEDLLVEAEI